MSKKSYHHLFFLAMLAILLFLSGCVHKQTAQQQPAKPGIITLQGTILHKSSRLQTIVLASGHDKNAAEHTISFDFRTRGMEHVARGRQVIITCKPLKNKELFCKALTIVPADDDYPENIAPIAALALKKKIDAHRDLTLIDTRPVAAFQACHIPGALSLAACGPNPGAGLRQLDHGTTLVLYCGWPGCSHSMAMAKRALADRDNPFEEIRILEKGLDGWIDADLITVASDRFILAGNLVLIDLRPARKNTVQRIPGSVSIPLTMLAQRIPDIPGDAPVVVYGDSLQESLTALKLLRKNGFPRAAMVAGDLHGWKKRHNPVTSGPVTTAILWQRPLRPGEISAATLTKKLQQRAGIVLDLRTDQERQRMGTVRGSIALPLNQLYKELDSLDKSKDIYCLSGPRGALASEILNAKGFRAWYLASSALHCQSGVCEIR